MPKSKREKVYNLTQVAKKTKDSKANLITEIREALDVYPNVFVLRVHNMRNQSLKDLRLRWKPDSRLFFGKNTVMQIALGRNPDDEVKEGISGVAALLSAGNGLLLTSKSPEEVAAYFNDFRVPHFAREGFVATQTITIPQGPLTQFSHALEPRLRNLGLPTTLDKAVIQLLTDTDICREGDTLTADQANLLQHFGYKLAQFSISIDAMWSEAGGLVSYVDDAAGSAGESDE